MRRARQKIGHHVFSAGGPDPHRNPKTYTPAQDVPGAEVKVFGWHVPSTTEPTLAGHDRVIVDVELLAPPSFRPAPQDLIDLPAAPQGQFEVIGETQDYNHGPYRYQPGNVINLRRVTG